jgi:hypothetical protein
MARIDRMDQGLIARLDELEQRMFVLKITYEKYFSGLERIEPVRERDDIKRLLRDTGEQPMNNSGQRFRYQTLKARYQSLELYWTRNLVMFERGTHPKMKFRADARARTVAAAAEAVAAGAPPQEVLSPEQERVLRERAERAEREERAYRMVFDAYIQARGQCGQSTDLGFDAVRDTLKNQVRQIKSQFNCESVKFRVAIEDGKAKLKAVPQGG